MRILDSFDITMESLSKMLLDAELNVIFVDRNPEGGFVEAMKEMAGSSGEIILNESTGQGCKIIRNDLGPDVLHLLQFRWEHANTGESFLNYIREIGYERAVGLVVVSI